VGDVTGQGTPPQQPRELPGNGHEAAPGEARARTPRRGRRAGETLFDRVLQLRYVAVIVVVLAFLHALAFLLLGGRLALATYRHILAGGDGESGERPAVGLLHSLDFMLVALVLLILSLGIARLFLLTPAATHARAATDPSWLNIESFGELKILLWETILFALVVVSLSTLSAAITAEIGWTALIVPGAILLLAASLRLMRAH
jgi:uncharacterized membrane protein YqhA